MKNLNLSQKILLGFIFIAGIVITLLLLRNPQDLRERATGDNVTAVPVCSQTGSININLSFTNTTDSVVRVLARDEQSGSTTALGDAEPGESISGVIETSDASVDESNIIFEVSDGESYIASYTAYSCDTDTGGACAVEQAKCIWDTVENTARYKVKVTDNENDEVIKEETVNHPITSLVFPATAGGSYTCEVTPVNSCGEGSKDSAEGSCPVPTSTPNPSHTPAPTSTPGLTSTPTSTPGLTSTPTSTPGLTSTPTSTPGLTSTPGPSNTPRPSDIPGPTNTSAGILNSTPTAIKQLPPTGFSQDVMTIAVFGSAIMLMGAFVVIFLW